MSMHLTDQSATVWSRVPAANGHAIEASGSHIVMSSTGSVVRLDESGHAIDIVASAIAGRKLVYPNDVTLDAGRGGFYITDSGYTTMPDSVPPDGAGEGRVYRIGADEPPVQVAGGLAYANGIALSPDGERLYVGESLTGTLWAYDVSAGGTLGARARFAQTPDTNATTVPDGISVDARGNVFVAHYGAGEVLRYAPNGTLTQRIPAGNKATSHVAISTDARTLYVSGGIESETGAGAIYAVDL